jgi:predicted alpha-1,2-mannosidase
LTDGVLAEMPESSYLNLTEILAAQANSLDIVEPNDYKTKGYVSGSPCDTLEYSIDDHCTAVLAQKLGQTSLQTQFNSSSQNWRNIFDPKTQFMCAKDSNGSWIECSSPLWPLSALNVFSKYYVEGDAWHYRWNVPQDYPSLIGAFSSRDFFIDQLNFFFNQSFKVSYDFLPNMYYWAGNEPSILSAYAFIHAGRPDLMHLYTRQLMNTRYQTTTSGLPGNNDYGTMSAWFVWNAMGLYPQTCQGTFAITSPLFDSVIIHREQGDIAIKVHNNSPQNVFVSSATLNGRQLDPSQWIFDQSLLRNGGVLDLTMDDVPPSLQL